MKKVLLTAGVLIITLSLYAKDPEKKGVKIEKKANTEICKQEKKVINNAKCIKQKITVPAEMNKRKSAKKSSEIKQHNSKLPLKK